MAGRVSALFWVVLSTPLVACATTQAAPAAHTPAAPAAATAATVPRSGRELLDSDWGWLDAQGFGIELLVPERAAWSVASRGRWFVARHAGSGAELSVRTWSARRTVSRAECESELFTSQRALREGVQGGLLEERAATAPSGFDGWLRLWIDRAGEGVVLATGAGPAECYAGVFRTRGDEAKLGGELRLAADGIFGHVRKVSVEDRRAPRPSPAF
jgi:hypothetical protein